MLWVSGTAEAAVLAIFLLSLRAKSAKSSKPSLRLFSAPAPPMLRG